MAGTHPLVSAGQGECPKCSSVPFHRKANGSTETQSQTGETMTAPVETWVFRSAFYCVDATLFRMSRLKRYGGFFLFYNISLHECSRKGQSRHKSSPMDRPGNAVSSGDFFLCRLRTPINYKATLCVSVQTRWLTATLQHVQEHCNQSGETRGQRPLPSAGHLWLLRGEQ